jgi:hypothetical protein
MPFFRSRIIRLFEDPGQFLHPDKVHRLSGELKEDLEV